MRASQSECVSFLRTDVVYVTVSNYSTIAGWRSPATARKFCSLHRRMLLLLLCLTTHHHLCLLYVWYSWANLSCCWQVHQHRCIDAGDGDGWCSVNDHVFSSMTWARHICCPSYIPFPFGLVSLNSAVETSLLSPSATSLQRPCHWCLILPKWERVYVHICPVWE